MTNAQQLASTLQQTKVTEVKFKDLGQSASRISFTDINGDKHMLEVDSDTLELLDYELNGVQSMDNIPPIIGLLVRE